MKISKLIEDLEWAKKRHGDVEVMIKYSFENEDGKNTFRTTVENLIFMSEYKALNKIREKDHILLTL